MVKIATVYLFLVSLYLTSLAGAQTSILPKFNHQLELESALFSDLESGQNSAHNYRKLLFKHATSPDDTEIILKHSFELLFASDIYASGGQTLIPSVYFATIQHLHKQGHILEKTVQNVAFKIFAELYRKYGKEEILFQAFSQVSANLFEGLLLVRQIKEIDYKSIEKAHFSGLLQGAYQVSQRLRIPHQSYLDSWLKEINKAWLKSSALIGNATYKDFIYTTTQLLTNKEQNFFSSNQRPYEFITRSLARSLTFYSMEHGIDSKGLFKDMCEGIFDAVWEELSPENSLSEVEGLIVANFVGNMGIMDKSTRQFLPKDKLFAGLELIGDYSFLTSQYSSAVLLLKNGAVIQLSEQTQVQVDHDGDSIYVHVDYGNLFFDTTDCAEDQPLILRSNTGFIHLANASGEFTLTPHSQSSNSSGVLKMLSGGGLYKGNNGRFVPVQERHNIHFVIDRSGKQLISADNFPMTTMEQRMIEGFSLRTDKIIDRISKILTSSGKDQALSYSSTSFTNSRNSEVTATLKQDQLLFETRLKEQIQPIAAVIAGSIIDSYYAVNRKDESLKVLISSAIRAQLESIAKLSIENSLKIELIVGFARSLAMHGMQPGFAMASLRERQTIHLVSSALWEQTFLFVKDQDLSSALILDLVKREYQKALLIEAGIYRRKEEKIKTYLTEASKITSDSLVNNNISLLDSDLQIIMRDFEDKN